MLATLVGFFFFGGARRATERWKEWRARAEEREGERESEEETGEPPRMGRTSENWRYRLLLGRLQVPFFFFPYLR